jgi:hypothetical protein
VSVNDLVLVQGVRDTRATLDHWSRQGWEVIGRWLLASVGIAVFLLLTVWVIATLSTPDPTRFSVLGVHRDGGLRDLGIFLYRNSLVPALHAMACVAGFIAGSSMPLSAAKRSGAWRWVHEKAGPLAIAFVICATTFSLGTQAYILGSNLSTIANQLAITPATLLVCYLPHAVPELIALYLPLAAWLIASRKGDWDQLLAATFVTLAISIPLLIVSVSIETFVSPEILTAVLPR